MQPLDLAQRRADDRGRVRAGDHRLGEFLLDIGEIAGERRIDQASSASADASATTAITSSISTRPAPCA